MLERADSSRYCPGRRPQAYLRALWALIRGNWGSPRLIVAVVLFPKVVHAARLLEVEGANRPVPLRHSPEAAAGYTIHRLTGIPTALTRIRHSRRSRNAVRKGGRGGVRCGRLRVQPRSHHEGVRRAFGDKVIVIHRGVDTEPFRPRERPATKGSLHKSSARHAARRHGSDK